MKTRFWGVLVLALTLPATARLDPLRTADLGKIEQSRETVQGRIALLELLLRLERQPVDVSKTAAAFTRDVDAIWYQFDSNLLNSNCGSFYRLFLESSNKSKRLLSTWTQSADRTDRPVLRAELVELLHVYDFMLLTIIQKRDEYEMYLSGAHKGCDCFTSRSRVEASAERALDSSVMIQTALADPLRIGIDFKWSQSISRDALTEAKLQLAGDLSTAVALGAYTLIAKAFFIPALLRTAWLADAADGKKWATAASSLPILFANVAAADQMSAQLVEGRKLLISSRATVLDQMDQTLHPADRRKDLRLAKYVFSLEEESQSRRFFIDRLTSEWGSLQGALDHFRLRLAEIDQEISRRSN